MSQRVAMTEEARRLRSGASCRLYRGGPGARVGVVVLHPWGPLGGSIHDPHVVVAARYFGAAGCATVRVQFRTGFSCGSSPVADVVAATDLVLDVPGIDRVVLVGYSYGSIVAMAAASEIITTSPGSLVGWVAVNPPLDYAWALFLSNGRALLDKARRDSAGLPKLAIHATRDQFCANASFDHFFDALPEPKTARRVEGADHFNVVRALAGAFDAWLRSPPLSCAAGVDGLARGDFLHGDDSAAGVPPRRP